MTKPFITNAEIEKKFPQLKYFIKWSTGEFNKKEFKAIATNCNGKHKATRKEMVDEHNLRLYQFIKKELESSLIEFNTIVWRQEPSCHRDSDIINNFCYSRLLITYLDINND